MSTLTRFKQNKAKEKAEAKKRRKAWDEQQREHQQQEKIIYGEFKKYIKPFDGETIGGLKIKVVCHDAKREIELIINGKTHRVFVAETEVHRCNCSECYEGPSGHTPDYSQDVNAYRFSKKGERLLDYFDWHGGDKKEREERFVQSFDDLIEEYKSRQLKWRT